MRRLTKTALLLLLSLLLLVCNRLGRLEEGEVVSVVVVVGVVVVSFSIEYRFELQMY